MFAPADIAKVAVGLLAAATVADPTQEKTPESFVPAAVRVLKEAHKAVSGEGGVDKYLEETDRAAGAGAEAE